MPHCHSIWQLPLVLITHLDPPAMDHFPSPPLPSMKPKGSPALLWGWLFLPSYIGQLHRHPATDTKWCHSETHGYNQVRLHHHGAWEAGFSLWAGAHDFRLLTSP